MRNLISSVLSFNIELKKDYNISQTRYLVWNHLTVSYTLTFVHTLASYYHITMDIYISAEQSRIQLTKYRDQGYNYHNEPVLMFIMISVRKALGVCIHLNTIYWSKH